MTGLSLALSIAAAPRSSGPAWILHSGAWNDTGVWDDSATWNDT